MNRLLDLIGGAAGWRQTDRLLTLTTPAGPDALLAEIAHIDEALGPVAGHAGFRIDLTVLTADAHQSLTALQGQPARLELQTALSRTEHRPFHGHISGVERLGANGGASNPGSPSSTTTPTTTCSRTKASSRSSMNSSATGTAAASWCRPGAGTWPTRPSTRSAG
jgi:type VI secretion system secreted protein VgrG